MSRPDLAVVPVGWDFAPIKYLARLIPGGTPDTNNDLYWDHEDGEGWVAIGDMSGTDLVVSTEKRVTKEGILSARLTRGRPGTVLFAMYASVGAVSTLGITASWNQALLGLKPFERRAESRFLAYALRASVGRLPFLYRSNTQNNLNASQVGALRIPVPPLDLQREIAEYLDRETLRIDEIISKQEALMLILAARRTATVDEALFTGRSSESRRYSGFEWLGEVSKSWRIKPLWTMFSRVKDVGHPEEMMLSVFREHGVVPKDLYANFNQTAENRDIYQLVHPGWLIANRMKAWQGSVGISGYRGIVSGHYICFRPVHDESHAYLNYLFRSGRYAAEYAAISRGVRNGQAEIDNDKYRVLPVLLPSRREQDETVSHLDAVTEQVDTLSAKAAQMIRVLRERRTALIIAAVTGTLDVRGR